MSNTQWVLKRRRYDGSESIINSYSDKGDAQGDADFMNNAYQSGQYYVEAYDEKKAGGYSNDTLVHTVAAALGNAR